LVKLEELKTSGTEVNKRTPVITWGLNKYRPNQIQPKPSAVHGTARPQHLNREHALTRLRYLPSVDIFHYFLGRIVKGHKD